MLDTTPAGESAPVAVGVARMCASEPLSAIAAEFGGGARSVVAHCVGSLVPKPAQAKSPDGWHDVMLTILDGGLTRVRQTLRS